MTDSQPSVSGRAEKEQQAVGGMWVYVQPMSMYSNIQQRQQTQVGTEHLHKAASLAALHCCA